MKRIAIALLSLGVLISMFSNVYGYDIQPQNIYSNGYSYWGEDKLLTYLTVSSEGILRNVQLNEDPEIWSNRIWEKYSKEYFSIDIRDRYYIPIDLLVSWNKPYIINYTIVHGWTLESLDETFRNCTVCINDLYDTIVLRVYLIVNDVGEWRLSYIGKYVILDE